MTIGGRPLKLGPAMRRRKFPAPTRGESTSPKLPRHARVADEQQHHRRHNHHRNTNNHRAAAYSQSPPVDSAAPTACKARYTTPQNKEWVVNNLADEAADLNIRE